MLSVCSADGCANCVAVDGADRPTNSVSHRDTHNRIANKSPIRCTNSNSVRVSDGIADNKQSHSVSYAVANHKLSIRFSHTIANDKLSHRCTHAVANHELAYNFTVGISDWSTDRSTHRRADCATNNNPHVVAGRGTDGRTDRSPNSMANWSANARMFQRRRQCRVLPSVFGKS